MSATVDDLAPPPSADPLVLRGRLFDALKLLAERSAGASPEVKERLEREADRVELALLRLAGKGGAEAVAAVEAAAEVLRSAAATAAAATGGAPAGVSAFARVATAAGDGAGDGAATVALFAPLGAPRAGGGAFDEAGFVAAFNALNLKFFKPYELLVMGARHSDRQSPAYGLNTRPPRESWANIYPTIRVLDALRARLGAPIRITSAYRSPAYNRAIGGARESQHMEFRAIDFAAEGGSRPSDWARALRSMRDDEAMFRGGVGLYDTFVHVDTRGYNEDW